MWVWQSQAPTGTSKATGVAGWDALARAVRMRMLALRAIAPINTSRRVSMSLLPWDALYTSACWLFAQRFASAAAAQPYPPTFSRNRKRAVVGLEAVVSQRLPFDPFCTA